MNPGDSFVVPLHLTPDLTSGDLKDVYNEAYSYCYDKTAKSRIATVCPDDDKRVTFNHWRLKLAKADLITFSAEAGRSTIGQSLSAKAKVTINAQVFCGDFFGITCGFG